MDQRETSLFTSQASEFLVQDHFRKVCTPNYVNVFRDRGGVLGVVEFDTADDLARAIRKLDDTEFRNPFERGYIRVIDDSDASKGGGRARSRSRSRSRCACSTCSDAWQWERQFHWDFTPFSLSSAS